MFKKISIISLIAVATLTVAGCSSNVVTPEEKEKVSSSFTVKPISPNMEGDFEQHIKIVSDDKAEIHLGGSGSCPPVIDKVDISDGNVINLRLQNWGDKICTMDYRPYSQVLETSRRSIDLNDFTFKLCNTIGECNVLPKQENPKESKA